jgi:Domain of Unknown Function (DUF1080)
MKKVMFAVGCAVLFLGSGALADDATKAYCGYWALKLPGGGAGWMGIEEKDGGPLSGSILWGGGSPVKYEKVNVENGALVLTRTVTAKKDGKEEKKTEKITAKADNGQLYMTKVVIEPDGKETGKSEYKGNKIKPLPAKPELAKVKFGEPIKLFEKGLDGWVAMNPKAFNGWSMKDGVLSNRVLDENGKNKHGTNLRTVATTFEDFNLKTEVCMAKGGNSGIYLRGIYEIQMADTFGKDVNCHNMGALYGRVTPSVAAEKPAGEWQTVDITLCDRHVTVILNGKTIIDNQPAVGVTGGAITSDEFVPGPIYLQGDHSNVDYRNMVLTPIIK